MRRHLLGGKKDTSLREVSALWGLKIRRRSTDRGLKEKDLAVKEKKPSCENRGEKERGGVGVKR